MLLPRVMTYILSAATARHLKDHPPSLFYSQLPSSSPSKPLQISSELNLLKHPFSPPTNIPTISLSHTYSGSICIVEAQETFPSHQITYATVDTEFLGAVYPLSAFKSDQGGLFYFPPTFTRLRLSSISYATFLNSSEALNTL
jgi:hypothetical protein